VTIDKKEDIARCRYCGKKLNGPAYHLGGIARLPDTGERAPVNYYGGYVCSYRCDVNACLDVESNMLGAVKSKTVSEHALQQITYNWD